MHQPSEDPKTEQWYKASSRYNTITPVTVSRVTNHRVTTHPTPNQTQIQHRYTESHYFAPTWSQAHDWLLGIYEARIHAARLLLQREQGFYGNIKGMKNPAGE
jgi:hypothetical protein